LETVQKIMRHASYKTTMDMYGTKTMDDVQDDYEDAMNW
jgi:integrase